MEEENSYEELTQSELLAEMAADKFLFETSDLPLREILRGSVFYPACGLDGTPLKHLSHFISSFVYVDYSVRRSHFLGDIEQHPLAGWTLKRMRDVGIPELWPSDFTVKEPTNQDGSLATLENHTRNPTWSVWTIWKRNEPTRDAVPPYLSLLFIGSEGVKAWQLTYGRQRIKAAVFTLIQDGYGTCGGGWTPLQWRDSFFYQVVQEAGLTPTTILSGGDHIGYCSPPWNYDHLIRHVVRSKHRAVQLWTARPQSATEYSHR